MHSRSHALHMTEVKLRSCISEDKKIEDCCEKYANWVCSKVKLIWFTVYTFLKAYSIFQFSSWVGFIAHNLNHPNIRHPIWVVSKITTELPSCGCLVPFVNPRRLWCLTRGFCASSLKMSWIPYSISNGPRYLWTNSWILVWVSYIVTEHTVNRSKERATCRSPISYHSTGWII